MSNSNNFRTERYMPVQPPEAFKALTSAIDGDSHLKNAQPDDFSMSVTFSSKAAGRSWGQNFSAYVVPSGDGSLVSIEGVGKVTTDQVNARKMQEHAERIVVAMSAILRSGHSR